jgi:uncharacterized protein (DUF362 family)/Pyruvate/2-oxoacid:ferredoxin oxidoreductase delta subunit
MERVSIIKCREYELSKVKEAISDSLDKIGGISRFISKDDSVLLKPNILGGRDPKKAITTHPVFFEAVIHVLKDYGVKKIALGESPAISTASHATKSSGLYEVCKRNGVKIVDFVKHKNVKIDNPKVKQFVIAKELEQFDKIINLPKMKTHALTLFTGAVKNLFGCIPGTIKAGWHVRFQMPEPFVEMLLELWQIIKPDLNIMDGIVGMEGNGPAGGDPRRFGLILASKNPLALDTVATEILGLKNVPLQKIGKQMGFKEAELDDVEVFGEKIADVRVHNVKLPSTFLLPRYVMGLFKNLSYSYPYALPDKCIGCGKCNEICPVDAITMKSNSKVGHKVPQYDYKKCIRCYCCHEICPVKAIGLKDPFLRKIINIFDPNKPKK